MIFACKGNDKHQITHYLRRTFHWPYWIDYTSSAYYTFTRIHVDDYHCGVYKKCSSL